MTHHDLLRKLDDQPFRPFRMRLVNNATYDILDPGMIIVGDSSAAWLSPRCASVAATLNRPQIVT